MMRDLYESGINEQTRIENETLRNDTFAYIQENFAEIQQTFADIEQEYSELAAYQDSYVINTTLFLFKGGVQATTLFL